MHQFFAYDSSFTGGVFVTVGDVNGDGFDDVITGPDATGGPDVRVFSGEDIKNQVADINHIMYEKSAFDQGYTGGVRVAAGDFDKDGHADIAVAPSVGDPYGNGVRIQI